MQSESIIQPARLSVDYPERDLTRLTTFFRLFAAIPILIVPVQSLEGRGSGGTTTGKRPLRPRAACYSSDGCSRVLGRGQAASLLWDSAGFHRRVFGVAGGAESGPLTPAC
jgi:hypothetical protein